MAQQPPLHLLNAFPSATSECHPAEPASSAALEGQPTHWSGFLPGSPTREPHQTWKDPPGFGALAHNGMEALNQSPHQIQKISTPPYSDHTADSLQGTLGTQFPKKGN